jgi:hypothetical protein
MLMRIPIVRAVLLAGLLAMLMLLAVALWAQDADEAPAAGGFAWWRLVKPLGIATYVLFAATIALGLLTPRNRALLLRWHKLLAAVAIVLATAHAAIVILT